MQRIRHWRLPVAAFLLALSVGWATESAKEILDSLVLEGVFQWKKLALNVFYISVYMLLFFLVFKWSRNSCRGRVICKSIP
jgi:hypothetical protein